MISNEPPREGRVLTSYIKVRNWLLEHISKHNLEHGDRIPSERQLADALGLSRLTVARAINELVKEGILIQQSRSGTFVGGLPNNRRNPESRNITVISAWCNRTGESTGDPFHEIIQGVSSVITPEGYRMIIRYNHFVGEDAELLTELKAHEVDGAVVFPSFSPDYGRIYARLASTCPPLVLVDHYFPDVPIDRVVTDNFSGARDAVRLLISRGHKRIAFLTECLGGITSEMERTAGYRAALEEAGISYDEEIVSGPQMIPGGRIHFDLVLDHLLKIPDPITAVFSMNDNVVWMVLQAINKLGLVTPRDLELAGFFDAAIPVGVKTPFIRVVQSKLEIGQAAARLLLERISGQASDEARHIEITPRVIE